MHNSIRRLLVLFISLSIPAVTRAGDVRGEIRMPSTCSPEISPAVVWLVPVGGTQTPAASVQPQATPELALVRQAALQFVPRVLVVQKGQKVQFSNEDSEVHNIHVQARGELFNQSMPPGQPAEFSPATTGILQVLCDIHHHMRAYLVVQDTPWITAISPKGKYRLDNVPAGTYKMSVWHEAGGKPIVKSIEVPEAGLTLETITLPDSVAPSRSTLLANTKILSWPEVIDQITIRLSASISAAGKTDQAKRARTLSEDAYWVDFESSDMETAVRAHLGLDRAVELEKQFLKFMSQIREATKSEQHDVAQASKTMRSLIALLVQASNDLKAKGITDRTKVLATSSEKVSSVKPAESELSNQKVIEALANDFKTLAELADSGRSDEASSYVTTIYFGSFEPFEQQYVTSYPLQVAKIESQFSELRGRLSDGLKGPELQSTIAQLDTNIRSLAGRSQGAASGTFAGGFFASFVTIMREGIEVIILLTILSGLVAKVGVPAAKRALYAGVILAVIASGVTAYAINSLVASSRAQTRELLEGVVMLAASGVLFYVSYWLIAQSQSKKWIAFLKNATQKGLEGGGFATIGLTAFLAIYREGAETALMYQALLTNQTQQGIYGIAGGLGTGLLILSVLAVLIRFASLKLPLQSFFKYTGGLLFALAVVFAGKGIFELQSAAILKTTTLQFPWPTIPDLGIYPNLQVFLVQAILIVGAIAALIVMKIEDRSSTNPADNATPTTPPTITEHVAAQSVAKDSANHAAGASPVGSSFQEPDKHPLSAFPVTTH